MADYEVEEQRNWLFSFFHWTPMSSTVLRNAEKKILSCLKSAYRGWFVDIGPVVGTSDKIWTISLNEDSPKTPILLLHGLGAGLALWCLNLDALAASRPVYAIDVLGFGRSSRPKFSSDGLEAENQLVQSVEEWRREMQLEKMILLGHSMGGFLAASYAIKHPDRVSHLILADPWGFPERPKESKTNVHFAFRLLGYVLQPLNPLWAVRFAGPFGQRLIEKVRPDIIRKFDPIFENSSENVIAEYIFQCNAQNPSGESAFHAMMSGFGWAKHPMIHRIGLLRNDVPMTCLYGSRSWVDSSTSQSIKEKRPDSFVNVQIISGAGHHVYADKSDIFNKYVDKACQLADEAIADLPNIQSKPSDGLQNLCDASAEKLMEDSNVIGLDKPKLPS